MNARALRATSYNAAVSQPPPGPLQLERRLGPIDAAAIVISNVIGVGIFIAPGIIAQLVPHPLLFLGVWLGGGLLAFAGAMAYAELGTLRPRSGGEYVYLREGYGPLAAFLTGWTSFVAGFAGAIAAGALGAADYMARFVPAAGDTTPYVTIPVPGLPLVISPRTVVALAVVFALAFVHVRGLGPGRLVQNTLAAVKVGALALFVAIGLGAGRGSLANLQAAAPPGATFNWPLAFIIVMFSYSGWNAASYVAEEIRDPGRNVPRALALGTAAVVLLYLGLNTLYIYAVPIDQIGGAQQSEIAMVAADRLLGPFAAQLLGAVAIVVLLASLSAMTIAGPRVYFAMARDGVFFRSVARLHRRFLTPHFAILAVSLWASLLSVSGTFEQLFTYVVFGLWIFFGLTVGAVMILRKKRPDLPRPYKTWGYPVTPVLFIAAALYISVNSLINTFWNSFIGLAIIVLGIPAYLFWRSRSARRESK